MPCPLCGADAALIAFPVSGGPEGASAEICATCADEIEGTPDPAHWRGLASAMWSEEPAVQVLAARMLARLSDEPWARDLADQLWFDEEMRAWVENGPAEARSEAAHTDANGAPLSAGDNVVLIKDLPVKGAGFTAKRGTMVRGISLVADNPDQIEGRVEGQRIVILTRYVKRK